MPDPITPEAYQLLVDRAWARQAPSVNWLEGLTPPQEARPDMPEPLTEAEVIRALERLARRWPKGLMLFGGPHALALIRTGSRQLVQHFAIPADGGDPNWAEAPPQGETEETPPCAS